MKKIKYNLLEAYYTIVGNFRYTLGLSFYIYHVAFYLFYYPILAFVCFFCFVYFINSGLKKNIKSFAKKSIIVYSILILHGIITTFLIMLLN